MSALDKIAKSVGCTSIVVLMAGTLAGCGKSVPTASHATTRTTAAHTSSPSTTPTTVASPATSIPATSSECAFTQLSVTATSGEGGLGHVADLLQFKNTSSSPCQLSGYPGVAGLDSSGQQEVQAVRTLNGYLGGVPTGTVPPVVTLAPGDTASATLEGTDVPVGNESNCPSYPALLVTPPNTRQSVVVGVEIEGCSPIQIHPVVAGTSGDTVS
jgi:hypothetical protein